jgi:ribosomal protein L16/L10AE
MHCSHIEAVPEMIMLNFQGQGQRMGGGKGPIDHYVTPVKARRVILEMGGKCEFAEVSDLWTGVY